MMFWMLALWTMSTPYEQARARAEPVSNLGRFLESYVGDCESDDPAFQREPCESAAKEVRKKYQGRTLLLEIESTEGLLRVMKFDPRKKKFRVHLTPFFSERALGLSVGKPKRLTPEGYPVVRNVPLWVRLPEGEPEFAFRRRFDRGMVRLEMVIKPKRAWRLKKRGEAPSEARRWRSSAFGCMESAGTKYSRSRPTDGEERP